MISSIGGNGSFNKTNILNNYSKIQLSSDELLESGTYNLDTNTINEKTNNIFVDMYRTERILQETSTITFNESCSNLNQTENFFKDIKAYDYCDHTSFNNISNRIETCKLDLENNIIHQIKLIENLSSNILDISYHQYIDHSVVVEPYTLIFIDGGFNNNQTVPYPVINDYNWNGVVIPNSNLNQNNGNYSINIDGVEFQNLPDEIGYKWIGLEYDVELDTIVDSQVKILDLNEKLSNLGFNNNIINTLRQSYNPAFPFNDNTAVIGFITITVTLSIIIFPEDTIESIQQAYNLTDEDMEQLLIGGELIQRSRPSNTRNYYKTCWKFK